MKARIIEKINGVKGSANITGVRKPIKPPLVI